MSQQSDERHLDQQERLALASRVRPEEWGAIPGSVAARGRVLSVCCKAEPINGVFLRGKGLRNGVCSKCFKEDAAFTEVI